MAPSRRAAPRCRARRPSCGRRGRLGFAAAQSRQRHRAAPHVPHHPRPHLAHLLLAAPAPALRRLGQRQRRRRCCWCTAAATIAATGTGWPRSCAATGTSSRPTCAATATASGRAPAPTRWPATSTTWPSSSISCGAAPVTIVAHSLGGNIALRYAGLYPENVAKLVAIEGLGPIAAQDGRAAQEELPRAHARLDRRAARPLGPPAAPLCLDRGRLQAHAGGEQAPHARAGAPPHPARRQPERGRHLQLEVRQLRALLAALRHDQRRRRGAVGPHRLPDAAGLRHGKLGLQPASRTAARGTSRTPRSSPSTAPATGCTTTGSTSSSPSPAPSCAAETRRAVTPATLVIPASAKRASGKPGADVPFRLDSRSALRWRNDAAALAASPWNKSPPERG